MDIEASYNFHRVRDKLTTSGVVSSEGLTALASQGYEVVLNLLPDTSEHAVADERDIVEAQGIEYLSIPVDFAQPYRSDFARFSEALDRVLEKKVHIHCAANYRVSAFYSLYEVSRGRWNVDQAMEFIHRMWQPAEYPAWPEFIANILGEHTGQ